MEGGYKTNHESTKDENTKRRTEVGHQFDELSGRIIEAALAVHKALGPGFLESVYEKALQVALNHRGIRWDNQREVHILFEGEEVGLHRLDLIVEGQIIVELKAVRALEDIHFAQVKSYLKATSLHIGLLLNFNSPTLVIKRVVL
jgi:GxxExxY protein